MSEFDLEIAKKEFLDNLQSLTADRDAIERNTILQRDSSEWLEIRKNLITASNFGPVCKRQKSKDTAPLVKNILYKSNISHVASIAHGIENEQQALQKIQQQENVSIEPCGLFIDKDFPFIGATPDGLIGNDVLVEVKCPFSASKIGLKKAIEENKIQILKYCKKSRTAKINEKSNWYFQVQGQLHVTGRRQCLFGIWAGEKDPVHIERIERDDEFWKSKMESKLLHFYHKCLLPEIVNPRHTRGMPIRTLTLEDCVPTENKENEKPLSQNIPSLQSSPVPSPSGQIGENLKFVANQDSYESSCHIHNNMNTLVDEHEPGCSTRILNFNEF
ncbi:yqaJ-like viral recombinase domain-containing protein [Phthorimaea operculella]|nr:yqaJ-like viral recombinase domain-containing protein [Phthorimaea operculella]